MSFEQGVRQMEAEEADKRMKAAGEAQEKRIATLEASVESMGAEIESITVLLNKLTSSLGEVTGILEQMVTPKQG